MNTYCRAGWICTALALSSPVCASDFNIPFINAAGLGNAYADWATAASDASTTYTNPAGLVNIDRQQLVIAALGLKGHTRFTGSTQTPPFSFPLTISQSGTASSQLSAFFPSFYYAAPINNRLAFGFGVTVPFALGTNYGTDSIVRYAATRSQVLAVDMGPSLGVKVNDKFSFGLGLDAVRLAFKLNNIYGPPLAFTDTVGQNYLSGWGYGWHGGILYQVLPATRVGASFNSMVMMHTTGSSEVFGSFPPGRIKIENNKTNAGLPARAQLSIQQDLNSRWSIMGTAFYTNWRTFEKITMKRVVIPGGNITSVTIPFNYHNTFDYSLGLSYKPSPQWLLRTGVQYMNTPSNDRDRGVADPIGRAIVIGLGLHYQQNLCVGYDIGYGHSFFKQESVDYANALTKAVGHNNTATNVFGAQIAWNLT
ncbi:47 kDa outer membrane protein [Aquicella siphonis]|uniref:47 kDa outer membrane protein n=2 Tax=Aquicella siphonis TaxID=254247 RepID=A0A5E4PJN0_9COXI|nr:47 kDa outer membrane protein [Aquicella siphonis]